MKGKTISVVAGASALLALAQVASAHPGHAGGTGLTAGIAHPFSGIDHILAMIAVGLVAARIGGRALWALPLTFLAFMVVGGLLAIGGHSVPMFEQGIAASVLVLGLMVAAGSRVSTPLVVGLVGLFAVFHGYAHGAEMAAGLAPAAYGAGFILATSVLISIGVGAGLLIRRAGLTRLTPFAGGAIALSGLLLFLTM